ncbi:hypothetical protein [Salibacterium aidingense]
MKMPFVQNCQRYKLFYDSFWKDVGIGVLSFPSCIPVPASTL